MKPNFLNLFMKKLTRDLVERHGRGIFHEGVIELVIHHNPDGKYLIKGGGPKVWQKFGLAKTIADCKASFTASAAA
jgi:hypothetical protein